jgi:putative hydrolase of the HAD superfamily
MNSIKWILFDFGGCLDSDGEHSRELFLKHFQNNIESNKLDVLQFQNAYTKTDFLINKLSLVRESNLAEMNLTFCQMIGNELNILHSNTIVKISNSITTEQSYFLKRNQNIIKLLSNNYKLGIISNFSGNLEKILDEFSLLKYFDFVLDSFHVGCLKPNPLIFKLAISKCKTEISNIIYLGDNLERDIIPAHLIGLKTIHLNINKNQNNIANYTVSSLTEVLNLPQIAYPTITQVNSTKR